MKKHLLKQTFKDTKMMITYVIMNDKWLLLLKLLGVLVSALQTYVGTLYIKWILDYITDVIQNQNFQFTSNSVYYKDIVKTILVIQCIALLLFSITTLITKIIVPRREYKLRNRLQNIFIEKATLQDLECYEDFGFYDNYTKSVRYADTKALEFLNILFSVVQNVLNIIAIASIIFTLDKYVVLIIIVMVVLSFVDQNISNRYSYEQYEAEESINRRAEYVKKVAHHKDYAKEVRIFRLGDFLISKLNSAFNEKYILYRETNTKYWRFKYIINLINTLIITPILLIYISVGVIIGNITIGSFTVLFNSCYSISAYLSAIIGALDRLTFESEYYVCKLRTILKKQSKIEQPNNEKIILDKIETIEFRNVWFHYPHHSENVLKDVSFKIEGNDTIALVGKNGAGKSTIIKLILRLYDVSSGEIFLNGKNIKKYDIVSLRECFSTVMQDYNIFNFTIGDNISMGNEYTKDEILESLKFVEMDNKIGSLEEGIYTHIGREFDSKGTDFSIGELQRFAIARAKIRNASCLILDEANSSLDPFAEISLNKKIMSEMCGIITIFVSHRLTTTVNATKIILLNNGSVEEVGCHKELMDSKRMYYKMFSAQSQAYQAQNEVKKYE